MGRILKAVVIAAIGYVVADRTSRIVQRQLEHRRQREAELRVRATLDREFEIRTRETELEIVRQLPAEQQREYFAMRAALGEFRVARRIETERRTIISRGIAAAISLVGIARGWNYVAVFAARIADALVEILFLAVGNRPQPALAAAA